MKKINNTSGTPDGVDALNYILYTSYLLFAIRRAHTHTHDVNGEKNKNVITYQ